MKRWKQVIMSLALIVGVGAVAVLPTGDVSAINVFNNCAGAGSSTVCGAAGNDSATSMAKIIVNTLLTILGIIAVIMIIVGGIRYTTSGGDASRVKGAKDTVMYSVIGLVVAILAFAIVNFVTTQFK